jgi:hypothetical protein
MQNEVNRIPTRCFAYKSDSSHVRLSDPSYGRVSIRVEIRVQEVMVLLWLSRSISIRGAYRGGNTLANPILLDTATDCNARTHQMECICLDMAQWKGRDEYNDKMFPMPLVLPVVPEHYRLRYWCHQVPLSTCYRNIIYAHEIKIQTY